MRIHRIVPKLAIGIIALSIIIFVLISTTVGKFAASVHRDVQNNSELIGEEIVFKGDTLMITDYDLFSNDFELENGMTISAKLVEKLEVIKNNYGEDSN